MRSALLLTELSQLQDKHCWLHTRMQAKSVHRAHNTRSLPRPMGPSISRAMWGHKGAPGENFTQVSTEARGEGRNVQNKTTFESLQTPGANQGHCGSVVGAPTSTPESLLPRRLRGRVRHPAQAIAPGCPGSTTENVACDPLYVHALPRRLWARQCRMLR